MTIEERQISLIGRRLNRKAPLNEMEGYYNDAIEGGVEITRKQALKGFKWLWNLYKSPTGKVRKNNPYGYREKEALESGLDCFTYDGHFNAGNAYVEWYTPMYTFVGKNGGTFQYYVSGGEINIIG